MNWNLDAKSGRCYFFAKDVKVNWTEAVKYCEEQGGFLTDIPDQETQDFLVDLNPYKDEYMAFYSRWWIGANDISKTGKFTWINSGHDVEYEAWKAGQPNHSGDCVHFRYFYWSSKAKWDDAPCSEIHRPICGKIITVLNHLSFFDWVYMRKINKYTLMMCCWQQGV